MQGQSDGSSVRNISEVSFAEELTGAGKAIFEGGFKDSASEARKKFDVIASSDQVIIGEQSWSDWGVIEERAIKKYLDIYEK